MREFSTDAIRNVVVASHSGSGKTTLCEAVLHQSGVTDRMGKVDEGNTVSDYLPDEIKRKSSISATVLAFECGDNKFNFIDTPGYADFFGEVCVAMSAAENVLLVANAVTELEIGLEAAARRARKLGLATFVFINHLDRERASYDGTFNALRDRLHLPVAALTYPLGSEAQLKGYIDVVEGKAYEDKAGKLSEVPVPAELNDRLAELRQALLEAAVESDDAMMEKYLEGEELTPDEIALVLRKAVAAGQVIPVLAGSAVQELGVGRLMQALCDLAVSPAAAAARTATKEDGSEIEIAADPSAPFSGYVFKNFSDPFTGRQTYIKVASGKINRDADVVNVDRGGHEKLAHLLVATGKKQAEVGSVAAGDIVLVNKLKNTQTGNTLSANGTPLRFPRPEYPQSLYSLTVEPVTHGDDDKLNDALAKLAEEDQTIIITRNAETGQTVVSGLGDIHLSTMVNRLKSSFGVAVSTSPPRVPFKETIRKPIKYEGKLKKQSGGHGQFADVWLELEPGPSDSGIEFVDKIVGGVVPRSFIPAVEEGVRDAAKEGPLAGYPLVDIRVTLYDGKYHDVDSSFQTFKIAGSMGMRGGAKEASPVLLEPIMETTITVPESAAGDVVGNLNSRRGQILGMEPTGEGTVQVKAYIPEVELLEYPIILRSLTQGRGFFTKKFDHYNAVPENVAKPIIEDYQKRREAGRH